MGSPTSAFSVGDLYLQHKITAVHAVQARQDFVAAVRTVDRQSDSYQQRIWICPLDGRAPIPLTGVGGLHSAPRWAPQGDRIAFISTLDGHPKLDAVAADGGEVCWDGSATRGVTAHRWLPDGTGLLMTLQLEVLPDLRGQRDPRMDGTPPQRRARPELAWRLPYKEDGAGYTLGREVHLFRLDPANGQRLQLTDGAFDVDGFDASPDGRQVAYVRHREGRFAHRTDLWVCAVDGTHHRQLTHDLATVMQPVWSPDGSRLAFSGALAEGEARSGLYLLELATGEARLLAEDTLEVAALDEAVRWSPDGQQLIVARARAGCHELVAVAPQDGALQTLVGGERQFGAFAFTGQHLAYSVESPAQPGEVFSCEVTTGALETQRTRFNDWWHERTPLQVTKRRFDVPDGAGGQESIDGWLIRAESSRQPQPLLNDVHGGPAAYALLDYDTNVFWQVLCSQGWAVLALNPVGSGSYGRRFCDRLAGHWGELDLPQHVSVIRQLQASGETDARLAISGKSYGGFLSAWAVGHTSIFRAAVVMAPVGNIESHYGTSDGGYYADPLYMNSAPAFDSERARALSPVRHISRASTPTLFLQGKDDERCPKSQSEELFVALCRAGATPTELVLYPGESHLFLGEGQPDCRSDAAERIVDWLRIHVGTASAARPDVNEAVDNLSLRGTPADREVDHGSP